jgi:hypothetical protein
MQNDLKESNIAKNKEFNSIVKTYLMISLGISVITLIIAIIYYKYPAHSNGLIGFISFVSIVITIGLFWWTLSGGKCPNCEARKYEKELSRDLVSETYLGKRVSEGAYNYMGTKLRDTYAMFNRTYNYHSICKYCGYEWTGTFTVREEDKL